MRVAALIATLAINLAFLPFVLGENALGAVMIIAMTFSGLVLSYNIIINLYASFANVLSIFSSPAGYNALLTPIPAWKILLSEIIPAALLTSVGMVTGIMGTAFHSLNFANVWGSFWGVFAHFFDIAFLFFAVFASFILLLVMICFYRILAKGVFYRSSARVLLSVIITIAAMWALNWLNLLLMPFGHVQIFGPLINLTITLTPISGALYVLVMLLQSAALFLASACLMERKINI